MAGRDHCRNINFGGAGGEGSHDIVVIQMVDEDGSTILDQSCPIQVGGGETAKQFAERIPAWWRCNPKSDVPCPLSGCPDSDYVTNVYTKPSGRFKLPKKLCGDVSPGDQHSCKIKFVYKLDKATGLPKKGPQLKICCKAGDECKGPKWGKDPVQGIPVNVQSKSSGISNDFLPTTLSLPVMVGEDTDIVVDPISVRQLPFSGLAGCRDVVAKQVFKLTRTILDTLVSCHADPTVSPASLCNSVVSADFDGAVAAAELALSEAVLSGCTDVGSPAKLAYSECPAPCDFLPFTPPVCTVGANLGSPCVKHSDCDDAGLCVAGKIGSSCGVDRDCDSTEGAGDGSCEGVVSGVCQNLCTAPVARVGDPCVRSSDCDVMPGDGECGNWQEAADCVSCLAREALEAEITELFGESGSSIVERDSRQLSGAARACKDALGQASAELTVKQLRQTIKCQKLFDRGKISLGGSAEKCKNADLKGKRSVAIGAAQSAIAQACSDAAVLELDTCGTNVSELSTCAVAAVETVTGGLAEAATPESRCGDGRRVDEQCDDGNGVSGDGCSPDCLCEGTCGDGVLNPLLVCGEFCDDGNDIDGDGCDSNCTPTGCGNSIVTAGEQCDGPSDDACPGQCRSDCRCPGSGFCGDGVVESGEQCDGGPCCTPSCTFEASGVSCSSDGDVCNGTETCDGAGSCQPGSPLQCADQNPCTTESCDPVIGCITELNDNASCDDNDLCTTNDSCLGGLCVGGAPPNCDDSNPCTDDSCDPASGGCVNVANTASCDDGDPCTIGDTCSGGLCAGGAPPNCDDSNPCTDDSCDPASGGC
ncbi:MAG: hypothetical protein ACE5E4_10250, partial [Candidatus Binatia bacterium]